MKGLTEGAARHVHALIPLAAPISIAAPHKHTHMGRRDKRLKYDGLVWGLLVVYSFRMYRHRTLTGAGRLTSYDMNRTSTRCIHRPTSPSSQPPFPCSAYLCAAASSGPQ